jgi:hypothetical protein
MAVNNIRVIKHGMTIQRMRTEANAFVGLASGDAIKIAGTGTNYATPCLNGDPERATDMFLGVSKSDATNTTAADGVIDVELCVPGTVLEAKANTTTNVNTDAKLLGLLLDYVAFDRSADTAAGTLTLDEDEGTDPDAHGMLILDGRITDGMMFFTPAYSWLFGA